MISKSTIKLAKSLALKKYRKKENLFLVEGDKMVAEILHSDIKIEALIATHGFLGSNKDSLKNVQSILEAERAEVKKVSLLNNPQNAAAICRIPDAADMPVELPDNLSVYLDGIQDPGNLGTILRACDWFGVDHVFCSPDTVDLYNPKVIQASMGSFYRVKVWETGFETIEQLAEKSCTPVYGAFMDGQNIYKQKLPRKALLVMGNEGNGIRKEIGNRIENRLSIPNFSENPDKAESLNVSMATAIICSEFKRPG